MLLILRVLRIPNFSRLWSTLYSLSFQVHLYLFSQKHKFYWHGLHTTIGSLHSARLFMPIADDRGNYYTPFYL